MKNTYRIALVFILAIGILSLDLGASASLGSFRTGIAGLLSTEFTAGQSARIGNAFSEMYRPEWEAAVNANTYPNTAGGKRQFAATKTAEYTIEITREYEQRELNRTVPTPTPIP